MNAGSRAASSTASAGGPSSFLGGRWLDPSLPQPLGGLSMEVPEGAADQDGLVQLHFREFIVEPETVGEAPGLPRVPGDMGLEQAHILYGDGNLRGEDFQRFGVKNPHLVRFGEDRANPDTENIRKFVAIFFANTR